MHHSYLRFTDMSLKKKRKKKKDVTQMFNYIFYDITNSSMYQEKQKCDLNAQGTSHTLCNSKCLTIVRAFT